jgi:hypothetical protein
LIDNEYTIDKKLNNNNKSGVSCGRNCKYD